MLFRSLSFAGPLLLLRDKGLSLRDGAGDDFVGGRDAERLVREGEVGGGGLATFAEEEVAFVCGSD